MKHYIIVSFLSFFLALGACNNKANSDKKEVSTDLINNPATASGESNTDGLPVIQFDKTTHDFGLIIQGEKVSYIFKFKNTGNSDLIIKNAKASCGCTVPRFPREPLAPGEEGEIEVIFDSHGRSGKQYKTVTVWSNSQPNNTKLAIESEIIVPTE